MKVLPLALCDLRLRRVARQLQCCHPLRLGRLEGPCSAGRTGPRHPVNWLPTRQIQTCKEQVTKASCVQRQCATDKVSHDICEVAQLRGGAVAVVSTGGGW